MPITVLVKPHGNKEQQDKHGVKAKESHGAGMIKYRQQILTNKYIKNIRW
jgi:hypothetical protein